MRTTTSLRRHRDAAPWAPPSASTRPTASSDTGTTAGDGHSFAHVSVGATPGRGLARKIGATGSGSVNVSYVPESADKSNKIVFLQVMRESLDWKVKKPGEIAPSFSYQDADTTSEGFHVDYDSGEKDPYYNGDDAADGGVQGDASTSTTATMSDTPSFDDGNFPAGSNLVRFEFRTSAFSAAGPDAGKYFGWVDWTFSKQKGKAATTKVGASGTYGPGAYWQNAIKLWNKNHGFAMPTLSP